MAKLPEFRLSEAAHDYWRICKGDNVTTEHAISTLTRHLSRMNPERPLAKQMSTLLMSIIYNSPGSRSNHASKSSKSAKHKSSIVSFPKET